MAEGKLEAITTTLPSYLQNLLQDNFSIKLVYRKKSSEAIIDHHDEIVETKRSEQSYMDLTGSPLKVDLGDDSVCSDVISVQPPSWTNAEAKQYPVTLDEARVYINNALKQSKQTVKPIYCICDGNNPQQTVILGASKNNNVFERVLVHILPCQRENSPAINFDSLKADHMRSVRQSTQIKYLYTRNFYLWGYNLQNHTTLENVENSGSVSVEISSNQLDDNILNSNFKLNMQVIIGHLNSPIHSLWKELCVIQTYIDLLNNSKQLSESTVFSENPLANADIINSISDLLEDNQNRFKVKSENKSLNLENLRPENILDKLWIFLKYCRKLSDLRDSIHFFFEELAANATKIHVPGDDTSAFSKIVNGILAGKLAVPTITFHQSLELMIDLGLEKLKNDYFVIINNFCDFARDTMLEKWRGFVSDTVAEISHTAQSARRTTRISINSTTEILDLTKVKSKFFYLDNMHKVADFMFLYNDHLKSEENFQQFCADIIDEFLIKKQRFNISTDVKKPRFCQYSFNLVSLDSSILKEFSPVTWSVKMTSSLSRFEVTTVFYSSEYPIFPPGIYGNYDVSLNEEESCDKALYVTKLVKFVNKM